MATEALPPSAWMPSVAPVAPRVELVPLDAVIVPENRIRSRVEVDGLRASIAANGLLQPVLLDENFTLVCGLHRLEACRSLGWKVIPAVVRACGGDAEHRLAEVDENLCRRELSTLERAEHVALRKKLWDEIQAARAATEPANDTQRAKKKKPSQRQELEALTAFAEDTARRTGRAQASVREDIRIGELPDEVRDAVRETALCHNRKELLALTRMDEGAQREAVDRVRNGDAKSVRPKKERKKPAEGADGEAAPWEEGADGDPWKKPAGEGSGGERGRDQAREALDDARHALERARDRWPVDVSDVGEQTPDEVLAQAIEVVRSLARQLG